MNTADRSLAMVDYALRRRFAFVDIVPAFNHPKFSEFLLTRGTSEIAVAQLISKMMALNKQITEDPDLRSGFCVGHSYFCGTADGPLTTEQYQRTVRTEIAPLIREYWFDKKAEELDGIVRRLNF